MGRARVQLGLLGYPLGHSLSPDIHQAALQAVGLDGNYRLYPIPADPEGAAEMRRLLEKLRRGELQGLNVTIPYKPLVLPLVDLLSPVAQAVGAVNTLYLREDKLVGDNTDVPGFLTDLHRAFGIAGLKTFPQESGDLSAKTALVLGAGGAARAVVFALLKTGWEVYLAARRLEQAIQLSEELHPGPTAKVHVLPLEAGSLRAISAPITLLVNATPLGMHPHTGFSPWPASVPFPANALVYDLVYNPPETELLRQAGRSGLRGANGLGMLVEQAALSFELWTGCPAPRQTMWEAAQRAIERIA